MLAKWRERLIFVQLHILPTKIQFCHVSVISQFYDSDIIATAIACLLFNLTKE